MTDFYDILLKLDSHSRIKEILWNNQDLKKRYEVLWNAYIGTVWTALNDFRRGDQTDIYYWRSIPFSFHMEQCGDGEQLCFFRQWKDRELYFEEALNLLNEGIQIYDEHGTILYFDNASKKLVGSEQVEGMNLVDVFDISEMESTVMTALRNQTPVRNRFTHYSSKKGRELITVNNAYPLMHKGHLIGALNLEENITLIQKRAERLEKIQSAMKEKVSDAAFYQTDEGYSFQDMIGSHPSMKRLKKLAEKVSAQDSNIMIIGETGTGKEILAQSIHRAGRRAKNPFIALNCAAVPESLIESILFGTAKGSFTGSLEKPGLLEEANHGTLFLDELNSMSLSMQSKVLRALQDGTFRRVGGRKELKTDVRVISSCNEDVFALMEQQKLRSDLFYRLATIILEIPPLRDRVEDIEELIWFHIRQIQNRYAFPFTEINPDVLWQLQQYSWPGNVRELFHVVDYAMNVAEDCVFQADYLPNYCFKKKDIKSMAAFGRQHQEHMDRSVPASPLPDPPVDTGTFQEQVDAFEAELIERTLRYYCGNVSQTAKQLGLQRQSLQYRIRKYGIRL